MTFTLTVGQIILVVIHLILFVIAAINFKDMSSGSAESGFIGFCLWIGMILFAEAMIWLTYFSIMYLFFT